jgi:hypothetical protein
MQLTTTYGPEKRKPPAEQLLQMLLAIKPGLFSHKKADWVEHEIAAQLT